MQHADASQQTKSTARLRLLQTTDLHMHLLPFDYGLMAPATDRSFASLRELIAEQRADGVPTLLCDTGDFLQGNAMADVAATTPGIHPMIAAFNDLAYDAIVLGNHDFDYGLRPLQNALSRLTCPALAANLETIGTDPVSTAFTIIPVSTVAGVIQVGLLGLTVPPSPAVDQIGGRTRVLAHPPLPLAAKLVEQIRADGADIVVALCHFGIDATDDIENIADNVAALPGIDAVLAGHTHDVFPGPHIPQSKNIDPVNGTLHGTPAVMAGAFGGHLGVIDLDVAHRATGWSVTAASSKVLQPVATPTPPPLSTPGILALHEATLARLRTEIATTRVPLSTHFSMIAPDMSQQVLADARRRRIAKAIEGTQHAHLPVLACSAPYRAGAKDAPDAFLNVAPGPITLNDVISIYPFQDEIIGVKQTGADLKAWLERSARRFAQITPGMTDQPLLNPRTAPYDLSSIFGLTYQIDPSRPLGARISDLCHDGKLLRPDDQFMVAATPYRHRRDKSTGQTDVIISTDESSRDILLQDLARIKTIDQHRTPVWRFAPLASTAATFHTTATEPPVDCAYRLTPIPDPQDGRHGFHIHFG